MSGTREVAGSGWSGCLWAIEEAKVAAATVIGALCYASKGSGRGNSE